MSPELTIVVCGIQMSDHHRSSKLVGLIDSKHKTLLLVLDKEETIREDADLLTDSHNLIGCLFENRQDNNEALVFTLLVFGGLLLKQDTGAFTVQTKPAILLEAEDKTFVVLELDFTIVRQKPGLQLVVCIGTVGRLADGSIFGEIIGGQEETRVLVDQAVGDHIKVPELTFIAGLAKRLKGELSTSTVGGRGIDANEVTCGLGFDEKLGFWEIV